VRSAPALPPPGFAFSKVATLPNLGSASQVSAMAMAMPHTMLTVKPFGEVRPAKLFIGGITRQTTTKLLREHFEQYGRVLDCVAMRQPDGRSRGFGYVTLDSPAGADRVLAEAQIIDGRAVDVKRAVPEGPGQRAGMAPTEPCYPATCEQMPCPSPFPWLEAADPFLSSGVAECWGGVPTSPMHYAGMLSSAVQALPCADRSLVRGVLSTSPPVSPSQGRPGPPPGLSALSNSGALSASATEFVPGSLGVDLQPATKVTSQTNLAPEGVPNPTSPKVALGDITNRLQVKEEAKPSKPHPIGRVSAGDATFTGSENNPVGAACFAPTQVDEDGFGAADVDADDSAHDILVSKVGKEEAEAALPKSSPRMPPGLPPPLSGLMQWQPDDEVSPLNSGAPVMPRSMPLLLSTVPMATSPHSVVASPSMAPRKEMRTIGTQTVAPFICKGCEAKACIRGLGKVRKEQDADIWQ